MLDLENLDLSALRVELTGGRTVSLERHGELKLSARPTLGFNLNWLREVAPLQIRADLGLRVDAAAEARLELSLDGSFTYALSLDEAGWVRLALFKDSNARVGFASQIRVSAQGQAPVEEASRRLAGAIW